MSSFPHGYRNFLQAVESKFDLNFLESIKEDNAELQKFFDCAIKDQNFWNSQNLKMKHRIIKVIETSNDSNLMKACLQSINELSEKVFNEIFKDVQNQDMLDLFEGRVEFSKENLDDIISFLESQNSGSANSHIILNHILLKKVDNLITTLNHFTKEHLQHKNFKKQNLPQLIEVAQRINAEVFLKTCSKFLEEKINVPRLEIDLDGICVFIRDSSEINLDQLKKCIKIFENSNKKIKISFSPCSRYQNIEIAESFLDKFKNNIYSLNLRVYKDLKELPLIIESLTNLTILQLIETKLTILPDWIGNLINLKKLRLTNTKLTTLPERIGNLINLERLSLTGTELTTLPDWIGNLTNLEELSLDNTELTILPESIGNLTNLKTLHLTNTKLAILPDSLGNLTNLEELSLNNNELTILPDWIGNLTNLKRLYLSYAKLTILPDSLGNLTNLEGLSLTNTELTKLPESMGKLTNLKFLLLSTTSTKTFPDWIENLTDLQILDLSSNFISILPDWIGNLTNLQLLDLSSNAIAVLPERMGNLKNLQELILTKTSIKILPDWTGGLTKLQVLDLRDCVELTELCNFEKLINLTELILPSTIDDFKRMKVYLELRKILGSAFSDEFKFVFKSIKKNLDSLGVKYLDFISNIDPKNSEVNAFAAFLLLARALPEKKDEIFSIINKEKIIDRNLLDHFMTTNNEYIHGNLQIDDLEDFLSALKLGIKIDNPHILKQGLTNCFNSKDPEIHKIVILADEIMEFLKTNEGKEILIKFRNEIFNHCQSSVCQYIFKEFPYSKEKNCNFYPIRVIENENENAFFIHCFQNQVRDPENLIEILTLLEKLTKIVAVETNKVIKICYWYQPGVDYGALTRDFVANLFYAASKYWNLKDGIPKVENKTLALLGSLLKYVFDSHDAGKLTTGEVFHESFFKGMLEFDHKQITSDLSLSEAEINKILGSGYNEEVKSVFDFLEWNDFSDSKKNQIHIETLMKFYVNEGLILNPELVNLIGNDIFESSIDVLIKFTILNQLPLDDNLINLIGREEYEAVVNGSDELKIKFIKDHRIQIEKWIKEDLEVRSIILKMNLRKANLEGLPLELINDEDCEVKYELIKDEEKLKAVESWIKENPSQLEEIKNIFRDDVLEGFVDQIRNLQIILKSMAFREKEWLTVKDEGIEIFKIRMQGEFSKDKLLEKIEYIKPFEEASKKHLKKWFDERDEPSLKKFTKYVTGSPTIPLNNIKFYEKPQFYTDVNGVVVQKPSRFEVRACFNQIDVPGGLTEEQILFYMDLTVADKKGVFDNR